jgi:hypothetical protein
MAPHASLRRVPRSVQRVFQQARLAPTALAQVYELLLPGGHRAPLQPLPRAPALPKPTPRCALPR